jgi:hypothetical protein
VGFGALSSMGPAGLTIAGLAAAACTALCPSSTQSQEDDRQRHTFYHGTSVSSGLALLNGAPLSMKAAIENHIDGPLGFYLAKAYADAEYFAFRRQGTVLQYDLSSTAFQSLRAGGAALEMIQPGGMTGGFAGPQLFIPETLFGAFDTFRASGHITVRPAR